MPVPLDVGVWLRLRAHCTALYLFKLRLPQPGPVSLYAVEQFELRAWLW